MEIFDKRIAASLGALALAGKLASPVSAQEVSADDQVSAQLSAARSGDRIILATPQIGYLARFPWVGGEADIALLTSAEGRFLGFVIQADCIHQAASENGTLHPTLIPGIYHPHFRLDALDSYDVIPEEFPTKPIIEAQSTTVNGKQFDCSQVGAKEDLTKLLKHVGQKLPDVVEGGAFQATRIARIIYDSVREAWDQ